MRNVSYKRVSTEGQEFHRQLANVDVMFDKEFSDKLSGKDVNRPQLQECIDYLQKGDWLWVHEISRLSRSVEDLRTIVSNLLDKGVSVKFVKEGLDFTASEDEGMKAFVSKFMLTLLGAVSEFERSIIRERSIEGQREAVKRGVKIGAANPKHRETYQRNKAAGLHKSPERQQQATDLIKRVQQMVHDSNGSMTQVEMVTRLNGEGFKTARGKVLTQGTLSHIIKKHC